MRLGSLPTAFICSRHQSPLPISFAPNTTAIAKAADPEAAVPEAILERVSNLAQILGRAATACELD